MPPYILSFFLNFFSFYFSNMTFYILLDLTITHSVSALALGLWPFQPLAPTHTNSVCSDEVNRTSIQLVHSCIASLRLKVAEPPPTIQSGQTSYLPFNLEHTSNHIVRSTSVSALAFLTNQHTTFIITYSNGSFFSRIVSRSRSS